MEQKICDKCKKVIKDKYYSVSVFELSEMTNKEKEVESLDFCPECYKKVKF